MKKTFLLLMILFAAFSVKAQQKDPTTMNDVYEFVKKCGHYFIATTEGNQPRVRPFGTVVIYENRLYIQTSKQKRVAQELKKNPKIEICALNLTENTWVRIEATAVADERKAAKQFVLDKYPELKSMYSADDDKTLILYLKDATAYFSSFSGDTKIVKF